MKIVISDNAARWYKEDIGIKNKVRFYAQLYGSSPVQQGYSLGFSEEEPVNIAASTEKEGILFFVDDNDLWFFNGHDLHVDYDPKEDELKYNYIKP